jgi:hypothetical protein
LGGKYEQGKRKRWKMLNNNEEREEWVKKNRKWGVKG